MQPQKLEQTGKQTFIIIWKDGMVMEYDLPTIQNICPCARCRQERKRARKDVLVRSIETIGRYGLRFTFTTGCDRGVYTYILLRRIGRQLHAS